jgi:hypothetical protein
MHQGRDAICRILNEEWMKPNEIYLRIPAHSQDLALFDYHRLWLLKDALRRRHYLLDEEVKISM